MDPVLTPSGEGPVDNPHGVSMEPLHTTPKRVAIVCLGHSTQHYVHESMTSGRMAKPYDEVWTLNRGIRGYMHDKLFMMDDMRWLAGRDKAYGKFMENHNRPIITSTVYPEFPTAVAYPFEQVHEKIGDDVFAMNTVAYMTAYAIYIGVTELSLFGADFSYPNGTTAEAGGQAVAFLLGLGRMFGMSYKIPGDSTLLYAHKVRPGPNGILCRDPYGYHRKRLLTPEQQGWDPMSTEMPLANARQQTDAEVAGVKNKQQIGQGQF